jgi:formylglycine-generating enzyme required for sulfatase activity
MPKIFISYRRQDSEHITGRIDDHLAQHFGREAVFMDIDTIPFGVDFRAYLDQAVGQCDLLLAIIGEDWLNICHGEGPRQGQRRLDDAADSVRLEIQSALARRIPVIPVLVGQASMPGEEELPQALRALAHLNAAEVRSGRDFRSHVDRLIRGIEYMLRQEEARGQAKVGGPEGVRNVPDTLLSRGKVGYTITNSLDMKFAWVPPGQSWLGGGGGKPGSTPFTLPAGLWCGVYPVTQAEWQAVMGDTPSFFKNHRRYPVESVSWDRVQEFLAQLNKKATGDGLLYRLPTEQEWEYICRGGPLSQQQQSAYHFYFSRAKTDLTPAPTNDLSDEQANHGGNLDHPSDVGSYLPNPLGIYDLHGNVWEWTSSSEGSDRVVRGGGWRTRAALCAAADRVWREPGDAGRVRGFRVLAVPSQ